MRRAAKPAARQRLRPDAEIAGEEISHPIRLGRVRIDNSRFPEITEVALLFAAGGSGHKPDKGGFSFGPTFGLARLGIFAVQIGC